MFKITKSEEIKCSILVDGLGRLKSLKVNSAVKHPIVYFYTYENFKKNFLCRFIEHANQIHINFCGKMFYYQAIMKFWHIHVHLKAWEKTFQSQCFSKKLIENFIHWQNFLCGGYIFKFLQVFGLWFLFKTQIEIQTRTRYCAIAMSHRAEITWYLNASSLAMFIRGKHGS